MYYIPLYSKAPQYSGFNIYYTKAKGINIWDGKKKYIDMSLMGIGANILGYCDPYVDYYVKKCIRNGNNTTVNHRIGEKLSEELLKLHPFANDVRYCKGGGEALKLALQIATVQRGMTVLTCGYNGWQIKNALYERDDFSINNVNEVITIIDRPDIFLGEIIRHEYPNQKVIDTLIRWQTQGTIIIIDELTSGFRFTNNGYYSKCGLKPDMVVYGKAISNGYPFACIVGKDLSSDLWISSTYWSEHIGMTAAYYTLKKLAKCDYHFLSRLGEAMLKIWTNISRSNQLKLKFGQVPELINFEFDYENAQELKSLYVHLMLQEGYLATDQFYPSFVHKAKDLFVFAKIFDKVMNKIYNYIQGKEKYKFPMIEVLNK